MPRIRTILANTFRVVVGIVAITVIIITFLSRETTETTKHQEDVAAAQVIAAKQKAADELASSNATLKTLVDNFAAPYGTKVAAVVIDLSNGATASANADQKIVSASMYKIYVAYGIYKQVDEGTLSLDQVMKGNNVTGQTISGCLELMITISDNDCGYALGEVVDWVDLDEMLKSEGYTGTITNNYDKNGVLTDDKYTTAHDVALLFQRLYNGTLLKDDTTADFLTILKADEYNDWLPSGLPAGTVIAHKTGALYGYIHDGGIIYSTKKNAIVVLLSGEWNTPETDTPPVFAALSSAVWSYLQ